jgi:hypothetical protein
MAGKQAGAEPVHYEFFGPHGTALLLVAMPLVVLSLPYACNSSGCMTLIPQLWVPGFPPGTRLYTHEAMAAVACWFGLVLLLHLLLPGERAQGVLLPDGSRLTYKLNGGPAGGGCRAGAGAAYCAVAWAPAGPPAAEACCAPPRHGVLLSDAACAGTQFTATALPPPP